MVLVVILFVVVILMGVGYWIDLVSWGGDNVLVVLFIKFGVVIIDNMFVLFVIGVVYGMLKDKDGVVVLIGFVGFLVLMMLCLLVVVLMI